MKTEQVDESMDCSDDLLYDLMSDLEFLRYKHEVKWVKPSYFLVPEVKKYSDEIQFTDFGVDIIKNFLHIGLIKENGISNGKEILLKIWPSHVDITAYGTAAKTALHSIKKVKTLLFYVPEKVFLNYARSSAFPRELVASAAILTPTEDWKLLEPRVMSSFFSMIFDNPDVFEAKTTRVWNSYSLDYLDSAWKQLLFLCCGPFDIPYHIKKMLKKNWSAVTKNCYSEIGRNMERMTFSEGDTLLLLIQWAKFSPRHEELLKFFKSVAFKSPVIVFEQVKTELPSYVLSTKKLKCSDCSYETDMKDNFMRHTRIHTGEKPYSCEECKRTFTNACDLKRHVDLHAGIFDHQCNYCGKPVRHISNLNIHIMSLHKNKGNLELQCYSCKQVFQTEEDLKTHVKIHLKEFKYFCQECFKPFTSESKLAAHAKCHSEDKPHKCHICGRGYLSVLGMTKHMLSHSSEAAYNCRFCDKVFTRPDSRWSHETRLHGDEKK